MAIKSALSAWNAQTRATVLELAPTFPDFDFLTYNGHQPTQQRACDCWVPGYRTEAGNARGWVFARHVWANRKRLGIWYVIFDSKIISMTRPEAGWIAYHPPASAIRAGADGAYHRNHIHYSTYSYSTPYGTVWLDRLLPGVVDSESVKIVQRALGLATNGAYDARTEAAAGAFQSSLGDAVDGILGKFQTAALLTKAGLWATVRADPSGEPPPTPPVVVTPPTPPDTPPPPAREYPLPTSGEVYLDKLRPGVTDSDSVAYVQTWLAAVLKRPVTRSGAYDALTQGAVTELQRDVYGDAPEYADGVLGKFQTIELMKRAKVTGVTLYADSASGGQLWPEVAPPPAKPPVVVTPPVVQPPASGGTVVITAVSANILRQTDPDRTRERWPERRGDLVRAIRSGTPDVVMLQEVDSETARWIFGQLGWSYDRCHGLAIGWRPGFLERVGDGQCFLYGDRENRYHHAVQLRHVASGERFWADCTHLENDGDPTTDGHKARKLEATQFASRTQSGRRIFGADLNSTTRSNSTTARGREKPRPILKSAGWWFLSDQTDVEHRELESHHGGEHGERSDRGPWIDDAGGRGVTYVRGSGRLILTDSTDASDHNLLRFSVKL